MTQIQAQSRPFSFAPCNIRDKELLLRQKDTAGFRSHEPCLPYPKIATTRVTFDETHAIAPSSILCYTLFFAWQPAHESELWTFPSVAAASAENQWTPVQQHRFHCDICFYTMCNWKVLVILWLRYHKVISCFWHCYQTRSKAVAQHSGSATDMEPHLPHFPSLS